MSFLVAAMAVVAACQPDAGATTEVEHLQIVRTFLSYINDRQYAKAAALVKADAQLVYGSRSMPAQDGLNALARQGENWRSEYVGHVGTDNVIAVKARDERGGEGILVFQTDAGCISRIQEM